MITSGVPVCRPKPSTAQDATPEGAVLGPRGDHRVPGASDTDPLPLIGLAQLYTRDVPDLPAGPDGADLLQVFWCPFDAHQPTGYCMLLHLRWRRAAEVKEVLTSPPQPAAVGYEGYVPEPCELHPEQVVTYPFGGLLPEDLCARIAAWEEALDEEADDRVAYQFDLSIPPGWRAGGYESWTPIEDQGLRPHALPTGVVVGNHGELNVFDCPSDPDHPPRWSVQ
ncbi:hypothetical protein R1T08_28385 [Streptomyces sp. SBC-4]|nr:hypothetical protein [Streptomyces sp. SBC-4]MDV5147985.1 hypothetical protein [Streptomyces sp. SBC-4]